MNKKNLRKIADRVEDKEVEIDLRGLGQFEIFKDVYVEPELHVYNVSESDVHKVTEHFGLKHEHAHNRFILKATSNIDFKMKYINLLTASTAISKHNAATKFHLFENGGLESHLTKNSRRKESKNSKAHSNHNLANQQETMRLSPRAAMTLTQIGLLATTDLTDHQMSRDELLAVFKKTEAVQLMTLKIVNGK